jgi:hypothetical protein
MRAQCVVCMFDGADDEDVLAHDGKRTARRPPKLNLPPDWSSCLGGRFGRGGKLAAAAERSLEPGHAYLLPWVGGPSACRRLRRPRPGSPITALVRRVRLLLQNRGQERHPACLTAAAGRCGGAGRAAYWGGGGPSALPRESARGYTPQTFGQGQTYGGSGRAEHLAMIC